MSQVSILHANNNTLVRAGLKSVLMKGGGVSQVLEAQNSDEMFAKVSHEQPDLLIIDFDQPGAFSDIDVRKLRKDYPKVKVLIISTEHEHSKILSILEHGVQGYLTRECDEGEIINAIFALAKGEKFYCNKVINIILDKKLSGEDEGNCDPTSLSERESEIICLIAQGMTNKDIAESLVISPHTVHTHRKNIMKKLGVKSASGLVLYAVNAGLIKPETI